MRRTGGKFVWLNATILLLMCSWGLWSYMDRYVTGPLGIRRGESPTPIGTGASEKLILSATETPTPTATPYINSEGSFSSPVSRENR